MKPLKSKSSKWFNESNYLKRRFEWQDGFGSFTYIYGQIDQVNNYIKNREAHHKHVPFLEEYETLLNKYKVDYDERYIFKKPK